MHALQMSVSELYSTEQSKNDSFLKVCEWLSSICFMNDWLAGLLSSGALMDSEDNGETDDFKRARTAERGEAEEAVRPVRVSSAK